jgi:hypothetical protein
MSQLAGVRAMRSPSDGGPAGRGQGGGRRTAGELGRFFGDA